MELLGELVAWFTDPENHRGGDAIANRLLEHLTISGTAVLLTLAIALPIGLYIGHTGRGAFLAVSLANIGRAVPSYALLVICFPLSILAVRGTEVPFWIIATLVAMVALGVPPVVTNTYTGLREVDRDLVEAARGMGLTGRQVLGRVEIPMGLPIILAGVRTASVQVVATATLAAIIGGGGLGRYIVQGIARHDDARLLAGAVMVAGLAVATELLFTVLQRLLVSPGLGKAPTRAFAEAGQVPAPASGVSPPF